MAFQNKLILLLKNIELNLMNDIYGRAHCPWTTGAASYNTLFCAVHEPKYALPLQGGGSLLHVTQGDGATRLCPGLLCYAPSGRLNACLKGTLHILFIVIPYLIYAKCTNYSGMTNVIPYSFLRAFLAANYVNFSARNPLVLHKKLILSPKFV